MKILRRVLSFLTGLLAVAKWLPLGQYRQAILAASAVLSAIAALVTKCDQPPAQTPATTPTAIQSTTPVHTPTPSPTPTPEVKKQPEIILDRTPYVQQPFTVRYTAPFAYNTHLWVDKYRLGYLGKDANGQFVLYSVILRSAGKRLLTVRNAAGDVLASKKIEVKDER